jgi:hypothetical protein
MSCYLYYVYNAAFRFNDQCWFMVVLSLVIALRPQTPKHIRGCWSHDTDTSEPVDGNGAQYRVTFQSEFRTRDLSITGPTPLPPNGALTGPKVYCRLPALLSIIDRQFNTLS